MIQPCRNLGKSLAGDIGRDDGDLIFTSYMLLVNEDVGDGRLVGSLQKVVLDLTAVSSFVEPDHCGQFPKKLRMKGEHTL